MGKWTGVVTNAGSALLAGWIDEAMLQFTGSTAGTGTVSAIAMLAQTALVNQKQVASVTGYEKISKGVKIRIQLVAPPTGYTLNQFGLWANLDEGPTTLLALFQNEDGVPIPSLSDSPDFTYTFYAAVAINNEGMFTVDIDPSALVSTETLAAALTAKQDKIMTSGILKGDGGGNLTAATPGKDYGLPLATSSGEPTGATPGAPGQHYFDSATGQEYVCTGVDGSGNYIWKLAGASDAADLTYDGQPLSDTLDNMAEAIEGKAGIDPGTGKIKADLLPDMDYDPEGTATEVVGTHNASPTAHSDIRAAASDAQSAADAAGLAVVGALTAAQNAQDTADAALDAITALAHTIDAIPSQGGSLTYTGSAQSPSWNSYNPETLTLGGTTTGTNAGSYTATFTPKEGYTWSDGTATAKSVVWTIGRASISATPSQSGTLTYSGGSQSPSWNDYNSAQLSLGGSTSGTNAGSYTATFTPKANYQWSDGTTAAKSVNWTIGKASLANTPSQSGSLTYTGSALSPSWSDYDGAKLTIGGTQSATNAGSYSATFTPTGNYQWSNGTTTARSASWSIGKAVGSLSLNKSSLTLNDSAPTGTITVTRAGDGAITATSSNTSVATVSVSGTTVTVTGLVNGTATITVKVAAGTNHTAPADKTASTSVEFPNVFGVMWNYANASTALARLTIASDPNGLVTANITTEPSPAIGTGSGSSPLDGYLPWSGMEEYNIISNAVSYKQGDSGFSRTSNDTAVFIPAYYFKIVDDAANSKRYFYVSDKAKSGFTLHPGSGKYVGRYNTISSNFSKSGSAPLVNITRATARSGAVAKGSKWSEYDIASWCAVWLLYLIEFADWDSQSKVGRGYVDGNSAAINSGGTDSMSYHTGRPSGTDGKTAVQYRHIENPWGNVFEWIDGANFNERAAYICTTRANYADDTTTNYTAAGVTLPSSGWIQKLGMSSAFPWAFLPSTNGGSETTYIPDYLLSGSGWRVLLVGGYWSSGSYAGLFYFDADDGSSYSYSSIGARLLFHP